MIACIYSVSAGKAIGIYLNPPSDAVLWRIIRSETNDFLGEENSTGLIYEGNERGIVDIAGLDNNNIYFYKVFYFNGSKWTGFPSKPITPNFTVIDRSVDPLSLLRDRIDTGFNSLITKGLLTHPNGNAPVLTESPQIQDISLPCITLHVNSDSDESRFIGDSFEPDLDAGIGVATEVTGYYSRYSIEIVIWTKNGDERAAYRKALKALLLSNTLVFEEFGIEEAHFTFSDSEEFDQYQFPLYMTICTFTCLAPTVVTSDYQAVTRIAIDANVGNNDIINIL